MPTSVTRNLIEMEGIHKRFGRVVALNGVNLRVRENEVMGLLGDNGSGKSTLVKTLVGVHQPDEGTIRIRGDDVTITSPKVAREYGISTVYQDLALVNEQTVAANMFLARNPTKKLGGILPIVDWGEMNERAERILRERMNLNIDPTARVEFLSGGERQAVAIARALVTDPDIVVMDEPTSALSPDSAKRVQDLVKTLRDEGLSVVIISHDMDAVLDITDRVTILENGNHVGTVPTKSVTQSQIVEQLTTTLRAPRRGRNQRITSVTGRSLFKSTARRLVTEYCFSRRRPLSSEHEQVIDIIVIGRCEHSTRLLARRAGRFVRHVFKDFRPKVVRERPCPFDTCPIRTTIRKLSAISRRSAAVCPSVATHRTVACVSSSANSVTSRKSGINLANGSMTANRRFTVRLPRQSAKRFGKERFDQHSCRLSWFSVTRPCGETGSEIIRRCGCFRCRFLRCSPSRTRRRAQDRLALRRHHRCRSY